ncbi:alkylated DNA repair protein alkB homolog 8-like [Artemia franciscana]|uniref:alkylated DNA repair protein alkB homolog 8-like n=1 Tax=Artemia franciscana TaxID=6661 RepID=UPI0032DA63D8
MDTYAETLKKKNGRKTKRKILMIQKSLNKIQFSETVSKSLCLLNFGHTTNASREKIFKIFEAFGRIQSITIIPNMSFSFVTLAEVCDAELAYNSLQGSEINIGFKQHLYLSYVDQDFDPQVLMNDDKKFATPEGLFLKEEFVSPSESCFLMNQIESARQKLIDENTDPLKHRSVFHFGYNFDYSTNDVDRRKPCPLIPEYLLELVKRMKVMNFVRFTPDQITVNIYEPGQGIPSHVDTHSAFEEDLVSLSLGSPVVMEFKHPDGKRCDVLLKERSLLVMRGEARYVWKHGIVPRQVDIVTSPSGELTCARRNKRISITFRQVRSKPCDCPYLEFCDRSDKDEIDDQVAERLENLHVHQVYDEIAPHFSATRHTPWSGVTKFLSEIESGSVLLDVGCGNAKYFGLGRNIFEIGCDRSEGLLQIAHGRGFEVFSAECRSLPFRCEAADYIISIAVIHHLANKARRLAALTEMARVLRPDGRCLVSVWSKDQTNTKYLQESRDPEEDKHGEFSLPIHKNRTQFLHADVLVPWTLRTKETPLESSPVYHRFYHVFEGPEFRALCEAIPSIKVCTIFQEQGNWIVIFEKQ